MNYFLNLEYKVEKTAMDFEIALGSALRTQFPAAKLQGSAFHWNQAIWRKVQSLGLVVSHPCQTSSHTEHTQQ